MPGGKPGRGGNLPPTQLPPLAHVFCESSKGVEILGEIRCSFPHEGNGEGNRGSGIRSRGSGKNVPQ